jgi:FixJ family two-component response regulator
MKTQEDDGRPIVFVIDDNASLRDALERLFRLVGLRAETFATAADFLKRELPDVSSCLVLDIRLPGISGLDFQAELAKANIKIPIVFMTGHGDIPMTVKAMKAGAVEFLPKPFSDQDMLDAVQLALELDRTRRQADRADAQLRTNFESLSPREREVMTLVTAGLMNKQSVITQTLDILLELIPGYIALMRVSNQRSPLLGREFDEGLMAIGMEAYVRATKAEGAGIARMMQDPKDARMPGRIAAPAGGRPSPEIIPAQA